jgi:hypothetical protein
MSLVIKRRPEKRLAKQIRLPGGRTVEVIEQDVEERLAALNGACVAAVRAKVQEMTRLAAFLSDPPTEGEILPIYLLSSELIGLSGVAVMDDLGDAALSFCRLLDGWLVGKPYAKAAFDVHLAALQLMSQPDCALDGPAKAAMVQGLQTVVQRTLAGAASEA